MAAIIKNNHLNTRQFKNLTVFNHPFWACLVYSYLYRTLQCKILLKNSRKFYLSAIPPVTLISGGLLFVCSSMMSILALSQLSDSLSLNLSWPMFSMGEGFLRFWMEYAAKLLLRLRPELEVGWSLGDKAEKLDLRWTPFDFLFPFSVSSFRFR